MTGREAEAMNKQLRLTDREWRTFFIEDLFDRIERGKRLVIKDRIIGSTPFITAGETNNGVSSFISNESHKTYSEAVTLDMFANAFYQGWPFKCDDNITVLKLRGQSKYVHMFLLPIFSKLQEKYSYAKQVRPHRLSREIIQLPASPDGTPDWAFMSAYMRQEEKVLMKEVISRLKRQLAKNHAEPVAFKGREWRAFKVSEIFPSIQRGKRIKRADHVEGDVPYVSASALNNGVDGFIGNREGIRVFANCLSLANSGSVGSAFFHPYAFVASDHVTKLEREGADRYIYLFFPPVFSRMAERYSFNHEISDARITRERIMLPVTPDGTPDWAFMSAYMQGLEREMLREALAYFKGKIR